MDYGRMMTALRRRRWGIVLTVGLCTGLTGFSASRMKREYQASATLMPHEQTLGTLSELAAPPEADHEKDDILGRQDRLKTVATVLTSPGVLGAVITKLNLKTTPDKLAEDVEVKEITSQVLRVSVKDSDREQATAIVNGIVDTFVTTYSDLRSQEARKQLDLLEQERKSADAELRMASTRLEDFKKRTNISSLSDQMRVGHDRASQMAEARNTAAAQLREVTAQYESVMGLLARTPETREVRESAQRTNLLEKMQLDVSTLRSSLEKELQSHTEEHPNVKKLRGELAEAERRLEAESNKLHTTVKVIPNPDREVLQTRLRDLRNQRDGLQARVASLSRDLNQIEGRMASYSGKDVELAVLQQRYNLAEQRVGLVTARVGQIRNVASLLSSGTPVAVVDRAGPTNPPADLSQGRTLRLTVLAFALSLAVCVALAVALELADRRVRNVADAEELMELPVVSVVPQLPGRASLGTLCTTTENDPSSHIAESYHFLANHILRQTLRRDSTVLTAATARPGQGATTALCNLAIALARAGRQVVLVEADLRRPFLHRVFVADHKAGLTDALQGKVDIKDTLVHTHVEGLRLVTAGSTVTDPWSLLWNPNMAMVVAELREQADYILFNVPSATVFADALCVAPHVDGAVIVMRTAEMPNGAERKVRDWLEEVEVPVMGVVLNGVPNRDLESFEYHRSYGARRVEKPERALQAPITPPVRRAA